MIEGDAHFPAYRLQGGETLDVRIHYATVGTPVRDPDGRISNAVLLLHWTGGSHESLLLPDLESSLYGPGQSLDASRYFLVFPDALGHGGSSKPSDGLRGRFPSYGYRDMVDLQHKLVRETLGIEKLRAVVGLSMGGIHAWMWAEAYPDETPAILPVVAMPMRISGRNLLWRRMVVRQIRADLHWQDAVQRPRGWLEAFPLFRMMLDSVGRLQEAIPDATAADQFVEAAIEQAASMDAADLLYALEASEDYDPMPEKIRARVASIHFVDDEFNPVEIVQALAARLPQFRFVILPGGFGHLTQSLASLWAGELRTLGF
jgi:homoserine O-acetyltransferase